MARGAVADESDFERQRLANIAERDELLKGLQAEAQTAGLYSNKLPRAANGTVKRKPTPAKKARKEELPPTRISSRLRGIQADSETAKRKAEQEYEQQKEVQRIKRQRVAGDLALGDILVNGRLTDTSLLGTDTILKGVAVPYERTFGDDDIRETTNKDLKALRQKMSGMKLWEAWEPQRIKIVPERIYSMAFHPTQDKPLVFAGDKLGNLGLLDASQPGAKEIKQEEEEEDDDADPDPDPVITTLNLHKRTISAMHTHPSKPETVYTASYDSSIRTIDLNKLKTSEIYGPSDMEADEPVSGVDMAAADPHLVYFTTLNGALGRHDTRQKSSNATIWQISEKKIGGFSLHPSASHYLATASLDRFLRVWDLRKITRNLPMLVGEHESRLSVSHAAFNTAGHVATASYDDSIKIHSFGQTAKNRMSSWASSTTLDAAAMKPEVVIKHNNQTGRWVTILKPQWQRHPSDNIQKFVIGNMNRFVDVFAADGTQLAQLGGEGEKYISAVPAVAVFHPRCDWVVGGTASGKACLWM